MKEAVTKVIDTLTQEDFNGAFQNLLEWNNKGIAAGVCVCACVCVYKCILEFSCAYYITADEQGLYVNF